MIPAILFDQLQIPVTGYHSLPGGNSNRSYRIMPGFLMVLTPAA
ncbi:hypothetical protein [Niabella drilacis]|nr:hypothetical protein [Niabella drilacis]